jgi:N-methylhydantoinase B
VEIVETEFPVMMQQFKLVPDSGGAGQHRGGPGYIRDYLILQDGRFTGGSSRYIIPPMGKAGGSPGQSGHLAINPGTKEERRFRSQVSGLNVKRGDVVRLQTAGGGGLGPPKKRELHRVISDLQNGYISPKAAKEVYGMSDAVIRKAQANSS